MDTVYWQICVGILLFILSYHLFSGSRKTNLPPGPRAWPIIGSILSCKPPLHESFAKLSKVYGPVLLLKLGTVNTVVISNAEMAKEVLKDHDVEFANRPRTSVFDVLSFNYNGVIGAPYGDAWKHIRRISTVHLFSPNKLNLSSKIRRNEIHTLVKRIQQSKGEINFTALLHQTVINAAFNLLFGRKHYNGDEQEIDNGTNFVRKFLKSVLDEGFKFNIGDLVPALRFLDSAGGAEEKFKKELVPQVTAFINELIRERREKHGSSKDVQTQDFVDVLTRLKDGDSLSDLKIVALLSDLLIGGTSTSEAAIDYAMAEMIRQPRILEKAQEEIDRVIGRDRTVDENDAGSLPYMQAIVKETLRLHPGAPVGLPHFNPKPARVGGYDIPAGSTVFVNLWAIGRDPDVWEDADEFIPERFLKSEVNPLGQNFEFIPFGAGRRICVGYPLAMRFIPFALATLLQAFDWSPLPGQSTKDIDMSDTVGAGLHRAKDLRVCAVPRLSPHVYEC